MGVFSVNITVLKNPQTSEILSFINPVEEYLTPLIKDAVSNMRELKELYCSEHDKLVIVKYY